MDILTANELERYDRQIMIGEIGKQGQEKLKKARVFIAGAGGLGAGSPSGFGGALQGGGMSASGLGGSSGGVA